MSVLAEKLGSFFVVSFCGGVLIIETAEINIFALIAYLCLPPAGSFCKGDTFIFRAEISQLFSCVPAILQDSHNPQICFAVVQAVMVYMVNNLIFRRLQYSAVHLDIVFYASVVLRFTLSLSIKASAVLYCKPFMLCQAFIIVEVNYCEFTLCEWYPAEGIAVS